MTEKRNYGYDLLRIIAISLVVCIHSNSDYLWHLEATSPEALLMLEVTALYVVSVPIFFMLSGTLLLGGANVISLKDLFFSRIKKQAIPFLLWSLIYIFARIVHGSATLSLGTFIELIHEPAYSQFWFMYSLFAIYLLLPVLQIVVRNVDKQIYMYILIIWFVFSILIPLVCRIIPQISISGHADLIICEGYIGYFLLGDFLRRYGKKISLRKGIGVYCLGTMCTGLTVLLEWLHTSGGQSAIKVGNTFGNYLLPGVLLSSIGLFIIFQNMEYRDLTKRNHMVTMLSKYTTGVFYIHMLILMSILKLSEHIAKSFFLSMCISLGTLFLSFLTTAVISRIPFVNTMLLGIEGRDKNDT